VLEDQQIIRIGYALQNVSGVNNLGSYSGYEELIKIQEFDVNTFQGGYFRDGIRLFTFGFPETANLERIEVLKGPASILFG
jgi:iron complex outermembrane receptor protein